MGPATDGTSDSPSMGQSVKSVVQLTLALSVNPAKKHTYIIQVVVPKDVGGFLKNFLKGLIS